jgi:hypothetical protein
MVLVIINPNHFVNDGDNKGSCVMKYAFERFTFTLILTLNKHLGHFT